MSLFPQNRSNFFRLVQMFVLFWISFNLLRRSYMVTLTLTSFATACCLLALLNFFGIASEETAGGRVSAFGEGANGVAAMFAIGILAALALVYGRMRRGRSRNLVVWAILPIIAIAMAKTGSRGGFLSLAAGVMIIVLRKGTPWAKIRNLAIVGLALGVLVLAYFSLELNRKRFGMTLEGGTMAGRELIFPAAWKLFLDSPLVGWGPGMNTKVLGARFFRDELDTHNLYLFILTEVGLLGAIPFFAGMYFCLLSAWKSRAGPQGVLPLSLMVVAIMLNMSLTWHQIKVFWLILALALASSEPIGRRIRQRKRLASDMVHAPADGISAAG